MLLGCSGHEAPPPAATSSPADAATGSAAAATSTPPPTSPDAGPGPAAAALVLAPRDTAYLTVTDWSAIKARLGAQELTSESLQTDRSEFWRGVEAGTVLLTEGALRAENSRLGLRYDLTQDDVRWEVRWVGTDGDGDEPERGGLALRFRDDLDLAGLQRAVDDEVPGVAGAEVVPQEQLLLRGEAEPGTGGLAQGPLTAVLAGADGAETMLAVPGCLSWPTALGVDADVEDQEAVVESDAVDDLLDPVAWGMSFTGRDARLTVVHGEGVSTQAASADAAARLALAESWPSTEGVGWREAFGLPAELQAPGYAVRTEGGAVVATLDYTVVNPAAASTVALAGLVPGAVCAEVDWLAEPTGL